MTLNIFVTGATGFVGKRLLARLQADHHTVTALSRSTAKSSMLAETGTKVIHGSLENIGEWAPALAGQEVVVHLASPIEVWGKWEDFHNPITLATEQLLKACDEQGVRRFIYISSESVLQGNGPLLDIDETYPYPDEPNSYYGKAKKLAEVGIRRSSSSVHRVILRPPYIWGDGDKQLDKVIGKVKAGQFMWADGGEIPMEMVHVENLVEAIMLALTRGENGETYFVTDGNPRPVREFLTALLTARGVTPPTRSAPSWLLRPVARLVEGVWRVLHIPGVPPLSRFQLDFIALPRRYGIGKIRNGMGYRPVTDFAEALQAMKRMTTGPD